MGKFKLEGLAETIFKERYAIHPEESWDDASYRLANHSAAAEEDSIREKVTIDFYEEIASNRFMPGGRIWYGSGRPRAQLLNCFVVPTSDSREGWGKTMFDVIVISGMGGGVGINVSSIRPRGSKIHGTGGIATGAVSLMQMINGAGDVLVAGGGRRMALMLDLNITHPDVLEFLDKKLDRKELNNANISIVLDKNTPAKEFVRMIKNNEDIFFQFKGTKTPARIMQEDGTVKEIHSIPARELWNKVVYNAWNSGEPGVLNGDLANSESNIWYHKPLVSTNPCGEIWLEEYGCCDLGALVLPRFVNDADSSFNWLAFRNSIHTAVRFLDNVLTVNEYPLNEIRENCNNVRRIGLGIMGLHTMLIQMGMRYSSDEAQKFVKQLMKFLKEEAYKASIDLAIEKGAFPAYDERFLESGFVKRAIPLDIQRSIRDHGIRNCALLTIAPTGTTGMVSNVSTGIEPLFSAAYWRRFYRPTADGSRQLDKELVVDPLWEEVEDKSVLEGAYDITPDAHFQMQVICQNEIDNATSKTINLPVGYSVDKLSDLWLEYLPYVKGTTFYRAGSRGEEPLEAIPLEEAKRLLSVKATYRESSIAEQNSMDCVGDSCEIPEHLKPAIADREQVIQFV